jgi:hypothetical protein
MCFGWYFGMLATTTYAVSYPDDCNRPIKRWELIVPGRQLGCFLSKPLYKEDEQKLKEYP